MKLKNLLQKNLELPKNKQKFLPSSYQRIGDIILIQLPEELEEFSENIGKAVLKHYKVKTVCSKGPVKGKKREPQVRVLAGEDTETVHKEDGILYALDVSRVMFSKGNSRERHRLPDLVKPDETVVDMFSGIGYFSIPVAKKCKRIFAIDINPVSIHYLLENARLNRVEDKINAIESDCRQVRMENVADRVIMGYLPGTEKFLPTAFKFLKDRGTIHFHNVYRKEELWEKPLGVLEEKGKESGYRLVKIKHKGKVKDFAPGKWHIVLDAKFESIR